MDHMTRKVVAHTLLVLTGAAVVLAAILAAPAQAAPTAVIERDGEPIAMTVNGRITIERGEVADDVWLANGRATVAGRVEGSVIVLNGGATITGSVGGDVTVVSGDVTLGPEAVVRGDVRASEPIVRDGQAVVDGSVEQTSVLGGARRVLSQLRAAMWVSLTLAVLLFGLVALRLAGDLVRRARARLAARPFRSTGLGVLVMLALLLLVVVTMASIIGGLLGLMLLGLIALVGVAGLVVAATAVGRLILRRRSTVVAFLVGAAVLRIAALLPFVGGLVTVVAALMGTGALLSALRNRRTEDDEAPSEAGVDQPDSEGDADEAVPASTAAGAGINLDLRPGHEPPPIIDDRDATSGGSGQLASESIWLDRPVAGGDEPGLAPSTADPVLDLSDGQPTGPDAASAPDPHPAVIAALPVREEETVVGPDRPTGAGIRQALFANGPTPGTTTPTEPPPALEPTETASYKGPLFTETDPTRMRPRASARDRLFADAPLAQVDDDDLDPGSLFSTAGRAWRPDTD
jgi:cytoskeletal protein CcmA (bactofilin family)